MSSPQPHNWQSIPLPKRMRALQRDSRGYPIPFVVLRDTDNQPHFTINNSQRSHRCRIEGRCAICGNRLDKIFWFVGGPLSAFHPNGMYLDTAMHHDCMTYALQVCPYLAAPKYLKRLDDVKLDRSKLPADLSNVLLDETIIPERPAFNVAVGTRSQTFSERVMGEAYSIPGRPYVGIEFWQYGKRIEVTAPQIKQILIDHEKANAAP